MRILLGSRVVRSVFNIGVIVTAPLVALCVWYVLRQVVEVNHDWLAVGAAALSAALFTLTSLAKGFGRVMSTAREMELLASQQQLEYLYERSPVPYLTVNKAGEITLANLAAARLMKASVENLIGQNLLERLVIENTEEASIFFGKVNTGITVTEMEMQLDSYDGARHWVLLSIFVYGRESERLVALVDITHQKQIDQAKSEFVALAAHQLRTPIAAIRWNAELLKLGLKDSFTEDQSKYYTKIERNVMRMINLINDFLSVSKLETGTFATAVVDIPLADFCASVIDEHDGMITEKKIRLISNLLLPSIHCRRTRDCCTSSLTTSFLMR
ncbi:MAG: histidine kinase dimerization/phospho-acceptor domain-containing protein [Candidatus Paceibacterota bacterium]